MNINDYVPLMLRRLRPQSRPNEATSLITQLAQKYGLENIGEIDEQFLNGFTCASDIVIAQLEKEFESDNNVSGTFKAGQILTSLDGLEEWSVKEAGRIKLS